MYVQYFMSYGQKCVFEKKKSPRMGKFPLEVLSTTEHFSQYARYYKKYFEICTKWHLDFSNNRHF